MMFPLQQDHAAARLLTASREAAQAAADEWYRRGVALFLVGPAWEAVKLPASLVHGVAAGRHRGWVRAMMYCFGVTGPVARVGGNYVVLVPPGTAAGWDAAVECVTTTEREAHYIGLPSPRTCEGSRAHWIIPPDGVLSPASAVRALVTAAADINRDDEGPQS